jgi:hypothetical protein
MTHFHAKLYNRNELSDAFVRLNAIHFPIPKSLRKCHTNKCLQRDATRGQSRARVMKTWLRTRIDRDI